jgi:murein DD-endopeptidase MepM/ murein hydrolase activator NlpD
MRAKLSKLSGEKLEFNDAGFIWPVTKNMVMATFHDPDYPYRYIFEHPAIDIRAAQGSTLRAAASGYVAIAKNAGKGYSYIMIVHGDGLATVYGHVSKIYVQPDEYVVQGQTIGLSGGMPGTNGAGSLTTGPHLHFEVRLNGIPVNPLEYLP